MGSLWGRESGDGGCFDYRTVYNVLPCWDGGRALVESVQDVEGGGGGVQEEGEECNG